MSGIQGERGQLPAGLLHRESINGSLSGEHAQITRRHPLTVCSCRHRCEFYKDCCADSSRGIMRRRAEL